jgi:hypothetical protein
MVPVIYILAEERSGSTWIHNQLAKQLGRSMAYIESNHDNSRRLEAIKTNPDKYSDTSKVYRTHIFQIVDALKCRPMFIRTTRHNTLEQMLSYFLQKKAIEKAPTWAQFLPTYKIDDVLTDKIRLTEAEVNDYLSRRTVRDQCWTQVDIGQTVHYEDLFNGAYLYGLGITLKFDQVQRTNTKYLTASYFENYEEIKRLVK